MVNNSGEYGKIFKAVEWAPVQKTWGLIHGRYLSQYEKLYSALLLAIYLINSSQDMPTKPSGVVYPSQDY